MLESKPESRSISSDSEEQESPTSEESEGSDWLEQNSFESASELNSMAEAAATPLVTPNPKKSTDSMAEYVKYFARVVKANKWDGETAAQVFGGNLEVGSTALDDFDEATLNSWELLEAALAPKTEVYREVSVQTFFNLKMEKRETAESFAKRIRATVEACYGRFAKANKEQLVRDAFVHGLPQHMKTPVLDRNSARLCDALEAALLIEQNRKTVDRPSHNNHQKSDSQKKTEAAPGDKRNATCYKCQRKGHFADECRTQQRKSAPSHGVSSLVPQHAQKDDRPKLPATVNGCKVVFVADSGATLSVLPRDQFAADNPSSTRLQVADKREMRVDGTLDCTVSFGPRKFQHTFRIADVASPLLGVDFLKENDVTISSVNGRYTAHIPTAEGKSSRPPDESNGESPTEVVDIVEEKEGLMFISSIESLGGAGILPNDLSPEVAEGESLAEVKMKKFEDDVFEKWPYMFEGLGHTSLVKHKIETGDAAPIRSPSYRVPSHLVEKAREQIQQMKDHGVVRPSQSEWCSPIVLVKRKTGEYRCAIDYRRLNSVTKVDAFPMPRIDELLDNLRSSAIFSKIDCRNGYYQVEVDEVDREKTAFRFEGELLEFIRMPFGLSQACSTFCRLGNKLFGNIKCAENMMDDMLVHSESLEQHHKDLALVFEVMEKAGLRLNKEKCAFYREDVEFLGYRISKNSISPTSEKVKAVRNLKSPTNVKQVKQVLGLTGYYRNLVADYAIIAAPLTDLLKKNVKFEWTERHEDAFSKLKSALCEGALRRMPDMNRRFIVKTDASGEGVGAILMQEDDDGVRYVVEYASKRFSEVERRYPVIEQEGYAILYAVTRWQHYLLGAEFELQTDHRPLVWLQTKKDCRGKLGRWALRLAEFTFKIRHVAGKDNTAADALSRLEVVNAVTIKSQNSDDRLTEARLRQPEKFSKKGDLWFWEEPGKLRLCVPQTEKAALWKEFHDKLGHRGQKRIIDDIRQRFFWPGLRDDVKRFARACHICAVSKDFLPTPAPAPMLSVDISSLEPMEKVSIDIMGPLETAEDGSKYLAVMEDYFSKWLEVKPISKLGGAVLKDWFASEIIPRWGVPKEIVSDRGSDMESKEFADFCSDLGIRRTFTAPYHHQSNTVERANRTIINMLRTLCADEPKKWPTFLSAVLLAYRNSKHSSIGSSPAEVMFGFQLRLPVDLRYRTELDTPKGQNELAGRLQQVRQDARTTARKTALQRKTRYDNDRKTKPRVLKQGNLVYWKKPNPGKLESIWSGPFLLQNQTSETNWIIKGKNGNTKEIHVNQLKPAEDDCGSLPLGELRGRGRPRKDLA